MRQAKSGYLAFFLRFGAGCALGSASASASGFSSWGGLRCTVKENCVPLPFSLATRMSSPMRFKSSLAMERPKPLPFPLWALSTL